ncbi:unnamed protein product [Caenorhabditis auriculariae]|uniref:Uncharacterized protein n=1 Tax=Caenorhabditis auriculariae TaxID=2777116 RepID=A0A8S1GT43_9PELO|nr:unnamed protein product [Caenorhabditis auriculariae]
MRSLEPERVDDETSKKRTLRGTPDGAINRRRGPTTAPIPPATQRHLAHTHPRTLPIIYRLPLEQNRKE